jgi:Ferritin-like
VLAVMHVGGVRRTLEGRVMSEGTTLKWRRHRPATPERDALRSLTGRPLLVPTRLAGPAPADRDHDIQLPELPATPLEKAVTLLRVASQIEHALMVQYLYAGYSFQPTQREITNVAIEEMSHLMTVQNLLRLIGAAPYLYRQDYGPPMNEDERLFPFDLRLEPLSHVSLAKYIVAESPASIPPGVDLGVFAHVVELATGPAHDPINRVGTLYALLGAVFGSQQLLLELAATGDPWFVAVNQLAAEAAQFYGGRDTLHLPDGAFQAASASDQASDRDWDRSRENSIDEFRVHVIANRQEALQALRDIGLQGEGPSPVATETAHFRRFYDLFLGFFGPDGMGTNPPPGVKSVPAGSQIVLDEDGSGDNVISHPATVRWARLADLRYAILLASLERYLRAPTSDRAFLRGWCFAEMFALSKLAELLRGMLRGVQSAPHVAALPFNLPDWLATGAQWSDLVAAFGESMTIAQDLKDEVGAASEHQRLLVHLVASDERKRQEATARTQGSTQRSRADAVRDVLDWAAGAGDPGHFGGSPDLPTGQQGRFWNLQRGDFVEVSVFGDNVTTPPSPGADAPLVDMLRRQEMPQDRPKLPPDSEEFRLVERWVADGCPDEAV